MAFTFSFNLSHYLVAVMISIAPACCSLVQDVCYGNVTKWKNDHKGGETNHSKHNCHFKYQTTYRIIPQALVLNHAK